MSANCVNFYTGIIMFHKTMLIRIFLLCISFCLPAAGQCVEHIVDNGDSGNTWELFDDIPRGASHFSVMDPVFSSKVIRFSGRGTQNGWKKNILIEDPVVKLELRTENSDEEFEIVFFVRTIDGLRRMATYSTLQSATVEPPVVLRILPERLKDSNMHTVTFHLRDDLLAEGIDYKEVYQIRIRGTGIRLNKVSSVDSENVVVLQPLLTIEQVTGDDTIDSTEDDNAVPVVGTTSEVEDGQSVLLEANRKDYLTTVENGHFEFFIPPSHVQSWPIETTLTATARNAGGSEVTVSHKVRREFEVASAQPGISLGNGMVNLSDRLKEDTRGLRAFPGAEGGGQFSDGGRGGTVYTVNTRDCSVRRGDGKVSVREVMEAVGDVSPGNRFAVFSVGGLFDCGRTSFIRVKGELTMACQTAPYPGVNIAAYRIEYKKVRNITIRGCQFFNHDYKGDTASTLRVVTSGDSSDLIFDRLNFLHTVDDLTLAFVNPSTDGSINRVTLSNSIVAESDAYSSHSKSMPASGNPNRYVHAHGASCLTNGTGRRIIDCSIIGNLFAHTARRNPNFFGSSGEIIGNYFYNNQETGPYIHKRSASEIDITVTDNVMKFGPNTRPDMDGNGILVIDKPYTRIKMRRNRRVLHDGSIAHYANRNSNPQRPLLTVDTRFDFDCDGAKHRDPNIIRILDEVNNGTGEIGIGTFGNPVKNDGDAGRHYVNNPQYYEETQWPMSYDTDNDGMEDQWELENNLVVGLRDQNEDLDNDGYTNIEEFVNSKIRCEN